jgi:p-hydroxybenzoate 3-monooxygenase
MKVRGGLPDGLGRACVGSKEWPNAPASTFSFDKAAQFGNRGGVKTQVCIIGAGPAGLLLGHLLRAEGVDCVVLERRSPDYVLGRIRAGVLEQVTVGLMERLGLDQRLKTEGLPHDGFNLTDGERLIRIDIARLTGKQVVVYGQTELTRDLMDARVERGLEVIYQAEEVALHAIESDAPFVTYTRAGNEYRVECRIIVGCDGFHGPSRQTIPPDAGREYEREYPFGWLGILADVPPCNHELIYANHERGFALASMRSETRSRYYIDVPLTERIEDWPDERIWDELAIRLGPEAATHIERGPALEKSIAPLRSFVFAPMRHGSLLLCGDAAHIVPPTGAKGLNLAASDVHYAAEALVRLFRANDAGGIAGYSDKALARVWKAERFSWSLTRLMHRFPEDGPFERAMQVAELDYIAQSRAAQESIAENYVGLPV